MTSLKLAQSVPESDKCAPEHDVNHFRIRVLDIFVFDPISLKKHVFININIHFDRSVPLFHSIPSAYSST